MEKMEKTGVAKVMSYILKLLVHNRRRHRPFRTLPTINLSLSNSTLSLSTVDVTGIGNSTGSATGNGRGRGNATDSLPAIDLMLSHPNNFDHTYEIDIPRRRPRQCYANV